MLTVVLALFAVGLASEPSKIDFIRTKLYALQEELWRHLDPLKRDTGVGDKELATAFARLDEPMEILPPTNRIQLNLWTKVLNELKTIDEMYDKFLELTRRQASPGSNPTSEKDWLDLAESILVSPNTSVAQAVSKLQDTLEYGDLFRLALQEESADVCRMQLSQHQLIYEMYNTIALSEIKANTMMQFSWMLLKIHGNYTRQASLTRQRYMERTGHTAISARAVLATVKRDLYRCDPQVYSSENYAEVTRLLQGYIENEVDMNPDGTCWENCAHYRKTENHGCYLEQFCAKQATCRGKITDCQFIESHMSVCLASRSSNRRYEWIAEYSRGRTLGKVGHCHLGVTKVDSWWRWLFWHCSYCMCLCDDATGSHRYFSLREAAADARANKVISGIRLVKLDKVIHLQVAESQVLDRGFVGPAEYAPVESFNPSWNNVTEGVDYHTLSYGRRALDLDELHCLSAHVLTGVRFTVLDEHLHFEIRCTPFNYTTGRLSHEKSQWVSNDNTEGAASPRTPVQLFKPDVPTLGATPLAIDSKHGQYVEFTHTDLDADAAQTTVPFIDVQPVIAASANSIGPNLNSGAGIYHRGADRSGGFIGLKLFTYDYSRHVVASDMSAIESRTNEGDDTFIELMHHYTDDMTTQFSAITNIAKSDFVPIIKDDVMKKRKPIVEGDMATDFTSIADGNLKTATTPFVKDDVMSKIAASFEDDVATEFVSIGERHDGTRDHAYKVNDATAEHMPIIHLILGLI